MRLCSCILLLGVLAAPVLAGEPNTISPFTLPDPSGKAVSPMSAKDQKALVVLFVGTECPVNNAYMPILGKLYEEFKGKGVGFVGINPNQQDTPADIAEHIKKHEIAFPVLKDARNVVADKFSVKRVPEAFLLDSAGKIVYRGRIDDQIGVTFRRPAPTRRDLAEAITEVLAGKPVSVPSTEAVGCLVSREAPAAPSDNVTVTYTRHVAAILEKRCVECHRPGEIGPMSLRTYDDVAPWAEPIREAVSDQRMPPWHAGAGYGPFSNDRQLTDGERQTLLTWIKEGCPKGDGDAPKSREFIEGWTIGKPDVVFTMKNEIKVPATAGKSGIPYLYAMVETNFEEDKWIQAAQAHPGAREVVHHIIVYIQKPGERRTRGEDGIGNNFLVAYAPGDMPLVLPTGTAKKIPKGSRLIFQMHYTPNGKATIDRSSVGLVFAKEPPKFEAKTRSVANGRFTIPPGDGHHRVDASSIFRQETLLLSLSPHMHLRGKDFEYRAVFPDGTKKTLLSVPKYDFNWQTTYRFEKPMTLSAGTRIECTAHFDNSDKNPNNPDPAKTVRWGDQTWEEMMIGFVDYVTLPEKK